ncbi:MAG: Zn-ribbon domain-containing OB-fold protein [Negativicutes bacterium]
MGTIYTYTVIHNTSEAFKEKTPYVMSVIDRGEDKVLARIENYTETQKISIGMKVPLWKNDEQGNPIYRFE